MAGNVFAQGDCSAGIASHLSQIDPIMEQVSPPLLEDRSSSASDDSIPNEADLKSTRKTRKRPRGPGLPESLCWIFLFFVLQLAAMVVILIATLALTAESLEGLRGFDFAAWYDALSPTVKLAVVASPALGCYFVLVPLGLWRMSPRPLKKLDLNLPTVGQTLIACSMLVPLTIVADGTMRAIEPIWQQMMTQFEFLQFFAGTDVHQVLGELKNSSLVLALFLIAVVPAFGEEFLFRGLIGRGLTARWGWLLGIGITSFLFAAVHMYPPHVIAILPVGVALHVIYLTTRSFWAPVLFHFLNNALATVMMRVDQGDARPPTYFSIIAIAYVVWCVFWLFRMRTEYRRSTSDETPDQNVEEIPWRRVSQTYALPCVVATLMLGVCLYEVASDLLPNLPSLVS